MSSNEIALRQPAEVTPVNEGADLDSWVTVVQEISKLASVICDTDFVPAAYRGNAPAATAAILTGRELGLPPMTALRHVQLVKGAATLSAEYKRARVLSAGHEFDIVSIDTTQCTVSGRRRGSHKPPTVITYTLEDARQAKLVKGDGAWTTRPRRMLFARAGTELCDFLFADVTNGLPTTELLAEDEDGTSGYDEQPAPRGRVTAAEITARHGAPPDASPAGRQEPGPAAPTPRAEPAGEAPDAALNEATYTDHDSPGTVTRPQLTKLGATFTDLGFTSKEREQRLVAASQIIGRDVESSSDLSLNEASKLIDTLDGLGGDRDQLIALLAEGGRDA